MNAISETLDLTALKRYLEGCDEIVAAYLFGSHARGETDARSNVDIALLLRPGLPDVAHLKLHLDTEICSDEQRRTYEEARRAFARAHREAQTSAQKR